MPSHFTIYAIYLTLAAYCRHNKMTTNTIMESSIAENHNVGLTSFVSPNYGNAGDVAADRIPGDVNDFVLAVWHPLISGANRRKSCAYEH